MTIPVWIEPMGPGAFRASALALAAEGATAEEAQARPAQLVRERVSGGARIGSLALPPTNPWLQMAGMWDGNDPLIRGWKKIVDENRELVTGEEAA
ncbi:MAG: hypothetical protein ACRC33_30860 [Gemmataceae bacterium]